MTKAGRPRRAKSSRKPGEIQRQASVNVTPEDWAAFRSLVGVTAARLGVLIKQDLAGGNTAVMATLPSSTKERIEGAMRAAKRELERTFEVRIRAEVRKRVERVTTVHAEKRAEWQRVIEARRGVLSDRDYKILLRCLHPDTRLSASDALLREAYAILEKHKLVLIAEKENPTSARAA